VCNVIISLHFLTKTRAMDMKINSLAVYQNLILYIIYKINILHQYSSRA
jgi:hypothetical protein